jgi:hypothetical protein
LIEPVKIDLVAVVVDHGKRMQGYAAVDGSCEMLSLLVGDLLLEVVTWGGILLAGWNDLLLEKIAIGEAWGCGPEKRMISLVAAVILRESYVALAVADVDLDYAVEYEFPLVLSDRSTTCSDGRVGAFAPSAEDAACILDVTLR